MEEEKGTNKAISVRFKPEVRDALRKYAGEHGESMNDVINRAVELFTRGGSVEPAPSPGQPPPAQMPPEILELPGAVKRLEDQVAELRGCIGGLAEKLDECSGKLSKKPVSHIPGVVAGIGIAGALLQKAGQQPKDTETLLTQAKAQAEALAKKTGRRRPRARGER